MASTETPSPARKNLSPSLSYRKTVSAIASLALGGFAIGVTEFAAMGLLRLIAHDFSISEPEAGHIISAYALGVVIGAPVLTVAGSRLPRRQLLIGLMLLFAVSNGLSVFAPSPLWLILARFFAGVPHGVFFGVASLVAADLAGPARRARAVSAVIGGLSLANVVGVPGATWLGAHLGWQAAFGFVAILAAITVIAIICNVPEPRHFEHVHAKDELRSLKHGQVIATLVMGAIGFGGMFAVYTYITWTMTETAGLSAEWMPWVLVIFGLGMVCGNIFGGIIADRNLELSLVIVMALLSVMLLVFSVAAHHPVTAIISFFSIGLCGSSLVPALQTRLMVYATHGQNLAAALNHSALNIANALGAWVGGLVIAWGFGYTAPAIAGAVLSLLGFIIILPAVLFARGTSKTTNREKHS